MSDPHLWALDLSPVYRGGPEMPVYAHLIVRQYDGGFRGEVRVAACGREFTAGTHPKGWWSTRLGCFPLQERSVHCGQDQIREAVVSQ